MKLKIKIVQSVVDRIRNGNTDSYGKLLGILHKHNLVVIGVHYKGVESGESNFPGNIDMCGMFKVGKLNEDEAVKELQDIDITDNPILVSVPAPLEMNVYIKINGRLEKATYTLVGDNAVYTDFVHLRIKAQIPFTSELDNDVLQDELLTVRKQLSDGKIAFHFHNNDTFILGCNEDKVYGPEINSADTVGKLLITSKGTEEDYSRNKKDEASIDILNIAMYRNATLTKSDIDSQHHCPVIQVEKNEMDSLLLQLNIDSLAIVHKDTSLNKLYGILIESVCRNVRLLGSFIIKNVFALGPFTTRTFEPEVLHFFPAKCGHFVSRVLNKYESDLENESAREMLHSSFMLPRIRPYFRRANRYIFKGDVQGNVTKPLLNPHHMAKSSNNGGEQALVQGNYEYYHYCQNKIDDDGWGCAYRSLQTLASWFRLEGYTDYEVPTFHDIQKCLFDIGDKPSSFVGSKQWIGSTEVNFVLNSLLGIDCKILYVSTGEEMATKGPELMDHFQTQGTPIMIGGGVLAHTILGVDYNRDTGDLKFLILDPHYTGSEDIKTIVNKGWCGWKGTNFWDKRSYYNMCMPLIPRCI